MNKFQPPQMHEDAVLAQILVLRGELGPHMGKIMAALKVKFEGQYQPAVASKLVKQSL